MSKAYNKRQRERAQHAYNMIALQFPNNNWNGMELSLPMIDVKSASRLQNIERYDRIFIDIGRRYNELREKQVEENKRGRNYVS